MAASSQSFREARERYRPLLERALTYFLEDSDAAKRVTSSALEQAERQWTALQGEANPLHLIGLAATDQAETLLPRSTTAALKRVPTALQIIRHLEWYDWEQRIEKIKTAIDVKRASAQESGSTLDSEAEIESLNAQLAEIVQLLFLTQLGLTDDGDNAGGGIAAAIPDPPPSSGPGETRTVLEALAAPRNP